MNVVNYFPPGRPPYETACLFTVHSTGSPRLFDPPTEDARRVAFAPAMWLNTPVVVVKWAVKRT